MAREADAIAANVGGDFFVDRSCIDCDLCRQIAPEVFARDDHLWATDDQTGLEAGRDVCWYSWSEQRASIARLAGYSFTHVLPGHGRRFTAPDAEAMRAAVLRAAA
ncbi:MAG TPA: ferredoxin [Kofleriaceae bacterium]|nr:ferredoxin [Kofleriaceae bacterium]